MSSIAFSEIRPEMTLSLIAANGDKSVELPLKLSNLSDEEKAEIARRIKFPYLALDVVVSEWKEKLLVVSFQNAKAKLSLIVLDNTMVYKFEHVYVTMIELKSGKRIHLLVSKEKYGQKHNRRHGVRIGMNHDMTAFQNNERLSVYVNDVSYCGVGLIEDIEGPLLDMDKPLIITLRDPSSSKIIGNVPVSIVRRDEISKGRVVTGCVIDSLYHGIMQKYIATRQMQRVKRYAANEGFTRYEDHGHWRESIVYQLQQKNNKSVTAEHNEE